MKNIADSITALRQRIEMLEKQYQRSAGSVRLLAVSKTKPASAIEQAIACGQREFGENYVQEAVEKIQALESHDLIWHFIGPVQSNKTRAIAEHFHWVQSLDRDKTARRLHEARPVDSPPLNVCIQINISGEQSKAGIAPEQLPELAGAITTLPRLRLRGLMSLPRPSADFDEQRGQFRRLKELYDRLQEQYSQLDTLSMGTSQDMEAAIAEGSTMLRIGTDIFGARDR